MIIQGNSITECWLKALIEIADSNSSELSPFIANFKERTPPPPYKEELETDLNNFLQKIGQNTIETTASTIFPKSLSSGNQSKVFERFDYIWKYIKKTLKTAMAITSVDL